MNWFRYVIGIWGLYCIGYVGGDILWTALWFGIAFGFIDLMKNRRI